jgi:hypothetical protein
MKLAPGGTRGSAPQKTPPSRRDGLTHTGTKSIPRPDGQPRHRFAEYMPAEAHNHSITPLRTEGTPRKRP